jgi:hypothetical protein
MVDTKDDLGRQLVKDAARRRAKRNRQDRKTIDTYKRTVKEIEEIAHRGRATVATGQTIARAVLRRREAPLDRLIRSGKLNVWERTAADEIMHAHAISSGIANVRDADLGIGAGATRPDGAELEAVRRIDTLDKLREWEREIKRTDAYIAVTTILFEEHSFRDAERQNRWRNGTAFGHLRDGLRHFAALRGNVPRGEKWRLPTHSNSKGGK